jgi:hypothetical protein
MKPLVWEGVKKKMVEAGGIEPPVKPSILLPETAAHSLPASLPDGLTPDLCEIINTWPVLNRSLRDAVLAIVRTASGGGAS